MWQTASSARWSEGLARYCGGIERKYMDLEDQEKKIRKIRLLTVFYPLERTLVGSTMYEREEEGGGARISTA